MKKIFPKPAAEKWSKKEILGHLIDSAANNHQRFVRVQFEHEPSISYDTDQWNKHGYYPSIESEQLINFWTAYNKQLAVLMKNIPETYYSRLCKVGESKVTLAFLMKDYIEHLEHHLNRWWSMFSNIAIQKTLEKF